jgi:carboxyl-terminal processing protease
MAPPKFPTTPNTLEAGPRMPTTISVLAARGRRLPQLWLLGLGLAGCAVGQPAPAPVPATPTLGYLATALDSIQRNALTSAGVNWGSVRREAFRLARAARSPAGTYPAIRFALRALGDEHSFLQLSDSLRATERAERGEAPADDLPESNGRAESAFGGRMRPEAAVHESGGNRFWYVFMPQGRRNSLFAEQFQASLARVDSAAPCSWIVDLRGNGGGDMWPMLAGLGPLFGDGFVGGSVGADQRSDRWYYEHGQAIYQDATGRREMFAEVRNPYHLAGQAQVAVLIDRGTASSGEAMAIAFRGRANARSFGERSYGASTSTRGVLLADGANIVLAVSVFADRNGTMYRHGITPDVVTPPATALPARDHDVTIQAAAAWLGNGAACRR